MEGKIKLLIVDSNEIMRKGLVELLSKDRDIQIVGNAMKGEEVIRLAGETHLDVILLDLRMQNMNGVQVIKRLHKKYPDIRCIIFSNYDEYDEQYVFDSINAGARGYMLKTMPLSKLVDGIKTVYRGGSILSPRIATKVFGKFRELAKGKHCESDALSEREKEIVKLIAEGLSNKQLADKLYISTKTVKTHVAHILEKLDAKNRTEAVVTAIRKGLIDIDDKEPTPIR